MRSLGQLRVMLLRAGAFKGSWRWPIDAESSQQPMAAAEKGGMDGDEAALASTCSKTNVAKVGVMLVRPERKGRLRFQRRVLWNGLLRYVHKRHPDGRPTRP